MLCDGISRCTNSEYDLTIATIRLTIYMVVDVNVSISDYGITHVQSDFDEM